MKKLLAIVLMLALVLSFQVLTARAADDDPDLAITLTPVAATVNAGGVASWTVTVTNNGPLAAINVQVFANLPAAIVDGSITAGPGCTLGTPGDPADPMVCSLGTMAVAAVRSFTITGDVDPAFLVTQPETASSDYIDLDAWVLSDGFDGNNSNNRATSYIQVTASADLRITKSAVGTPTAGAEIHYEMQISNLGPSWAEDVSLRDFLPNEVQFLSAFVDYKDGLGVVPLACDLTVGSNAVFCPLGNIPPTGTTPIVVFINVRILPDATGDILNTADVNLTDTPDPVGANNSASSRVDLRYAADVDIVKTASPATVVAGEQVKYTVVVTNNGPSSVYNVTLTDPLTAALAYEADNAGCTLVAGVVTCDLGQMMPGMSQTVYIWARVLPEAPVTPITNTSCVAYMLGDATEHRTCDSAVTAVQQKADLRVLKFGKPDGELRADELLTYTVIVDNFGPSAADNVIFTDEIRADGEFDILGVLPDALGLHDLGITCTIDAPTSSAPVNPIVANLPVGQPYVPGADPLAPDINQRATITCVLNGTLPVFDPSLIGSDPAVSYGRIIMEVAVRAHDGVTIDNCVDVTSAATDPNFANNGACTEHEITDLADLSVTKTALGEVQVVGQPGRVFNITTPGQAFPLGPSYTTSASQVTAGRRVQYSLTVTNNGPSAAENVVVVDRLPVGVVFYPGSLVLSQGSCVTGTPGSVLDRMTCGLGTIASGGTATITFQVLVGSWVPAGEVLENDVYVSSDVYDADNSDNYGSVQLIANTWADMSITKTSVGEVVTGYNPALGEFISVDNPNEVTAGMMLRYELTVQNDGASDAVNVQILDVLPDVFAGIQHYAVTFDHAVGASCRPDDEHALWTVLWPGSSATGQGLICELGTVPAGARKTFDVYVRVNPSVPAGTVIDNGALVLFGPSSPPSQPPSLFPGSPTIPPALPVTNDPDTNDNFVVQNTTVSAAVDLEVVKTGTPVKVFAGEQMVYMVTVTNHGPSTALNVVAVDTLPLDVTYEIDTLGSPCSLTSTSPDVLTCNLGNLGPGRSVTYGIYVKVNPDTVIPSAGPGATIINTVVVTTTSTDVYAANNTASARNLVLGSADLSVAKYGPLGAVDAGEELTYLVVVDNLGPGYAHNVVISDLLQSTGSFQLVSVSSDRPASCSPLSGTFNELLQLLCTLDDPLEVPIPGSSGRWILTVVILADEAQTLNNVAQVRTTDTDPDMSNNRAVVQGEIGATVDLSIAKIELGQVINSSCVTCDKTNQVTAGLELTYVLVVRNYGPSVAENVIVKDRLPAGIVVTAISPDKGSCLSGTPGMPDDPMVCGLGSLDVGEIVEIKIVASVLSSVPAGAVLENDAYITSDTFELDNGNNMATNLTLVSAVADLSLTMEQVPDYAMPGQQVTYLLTVENLGPSDAMNAILMDTLSSLLIDVSWECTAFDGASCPSGGVGDIFDPVDLPAGGWVLVKIVGTLDPFRTGPTLTNFAEVHPPSDVVDCKMGNNNDTEINSFYTNPTFADVPDTYWAYSFIERLWASGITSGCDVDPLRFCPEDSTTRAEMAVFLERGKYGRYFAPPRGTGLLFGDVPGTHWAVDWIEKLYADRLTNGCDHASMLYCPENPVSRAEMAVFLLRSRHGVAYSPPAAVGIFADVPVTHWAAAWIEALFTEGITSGCGTAPLRYCPDVPVKRSEMAVFLIRTFNLP